MNQLVQNSVNHRCSQKQTHFGTTLQLR